MTNLDMPSQRLIIKALRHQILHWKMMCDAPDIDEDDAADIQNDIGYAYTVLSELEERFFRQFGIHCE